MQDKRFYEPRRAHCGCVSALSAVKVTLRLSPVKLSAQPSDQPSERLQTSSYKVSSLSRRCAASVEAKHQGSFENRTEN